MDNGPSQNLTLQTFSSGELKMLFLLGLFFQFQVQPYERIVLVSFCSCCSPGMLCEASNSFAGTLELSSWAGTLEVSSWAGTLEVSSWAGTLEVSSWANWSRIRSILIHTSSVSVWSTSSTFRRTSLSNIRALKT